MDDKDDQPELPLPEITGSMTVHEEEDALHPKLPPVKEDEAS